VVTETVDSPWVFEIEMQGSYSVQVVARNLGDDGDVACRITGAEIGDGGITTGGQADAQCSGSVTRSGGTIESSYTTDFTLREVPEPTVAPEPIATPEPVEEAAPAEPDPVPDEVFMISDMEAIDLPGGNPFRITQRDGWMLLGGGTVVTVIDLATSEFSSPQPAGLQNSTMPSFGDDFLMYSPDCDGNKVYRFAGDSAEVEIVAELAGCPFAVQAVGGVLWVGLGEAEQLVRIDLTTGEELSRVDLVGPPTSLLDWQGEMYVGIDDQPVAHRFDLASGEFLADIELLGEPRWFVGSEDRLFARVSEPTAMVLIEDGISVADGPYRSIVFAADGTIYAQEGDVLSRLSDDASATEVFAQIESGFFLVAASDEWLYMLGDQQVYRVDARLLE
jgi:hypothetical protein